MDARVVLGVVGTGVVLVVDTTVVRAPSSLGRGGDDGVGFDCVMVILDTIRAATKWQVQSMCMCMRRALDVRVRMRVRVDVGWDLG